MTIHTSIPETDVVDSFDDLIATASHEIIPWVRGLETPMTPANLHEAADENAFRAIYFAYEMHFKSKADLVRMAQRDNAAEEMSMLLECFGSAIDWLDGLICVLKGAQARMLCGAAAAALLEDAA
jgi:hypothetical protein